MGSEAKGYRQAISARKRAAARGRGGLVALATLIAALAVGVPVALAAAPANDDFSAAQAIPSDGLAVGTNLDSTAETGEPNHAASVHGQPFHSIWYSWTPSADGSATINTCGSAFDTRLAVYTGSSVDALSEVTSNDDAPDGGACPASKFSEVSFSAVAGTTYRIAVDTNGDLAGDGSGPPQGEVRLAVSGPGIGPAPEPTPEPEPEPAPGGETETTTPGTPTPISATGVTLRMPDLTPEKVGGKWKFKTPIDAYAELKKLIAQGLNVDYALRKMPLKRFPKEQREQLRKNPGSGSQIIKTIPAPGSELSSTITDPAVMRIAYWDPTSDKRYLAELKREEERERKKAEEKRKKEEEERNRCKLDDYDVQDINVLVSAKTYDEAAKVIRSFKCVPVIYKSFDSNRIESEMVLRALKGENLEEKLPKAKLKNAIGLEVVRPKAPDFTITFREDPDKIADQDQLSLVPQADGDWVLPAAAKNTSRVTIQVNERLTGRFVAGATLQIFSGNTGKLLLDTKTDGSGEKTVTFSTPKPNLINVNAIYDGAGAERMSAARDIPVKKLGGTVRTACGRSLALKNNVYKGTKSELDKCRGLELAPANLGTGRGVSQPRVPVTEQVSALAVAQDGSQQLLAGSYNAISISGSNTIVAADTGIIATGGGNLIGQAGGNAAATETRAAAKLRRAGFFGFIGDLYNNIVTNVSRAFSQNLSNTRKVLQPAQAQSVANTASTLAQNGAAVPPQQSLSPKGVGIISTGGGNLIGQAGGNVISVGGGNLISDKGLGLISDKGLGVIATGGGNLMPVNGGQIISRDGAS